MGCLFSRREEDSDDESPLPLPRPRRVSPRLSEILEYELSRSKDALLDTVEREIKYAEELKKEREEQKEESDRVKALSTKKQEQIRKKLEDLKDVQEEDITKGDDEDRKLTPGQLKKALRRQLELLENLERYHADYNGNNEHTYQELLKIRHELQNLDQVQLLDRRDVLNQFKLRLRKLHDDETNALLGHAAVFAAAAKAQN